MTAVWLLTVFIVIALIVHWAIQNDRVGDDGETFGLFAMNDKKPEARHRKRQ